MASRQEQIEELLQTKEFNPGDFPTKWIIDQRNWLRKLTDAELVEMVRGSIGALAWRMVAPEGAGVPPSGEVHKAAMKRAVELLARSMK